jgi:hypothetical protein
MNKEQARQITIEPVISYPREAEPSKTYLMSVDLRFPLGQEEWPYDEEEYEIYCLLDTAPLFNNRELGEAVVVLHRFGGTYGPSCFLLTANQHEMREPTGFITLTLANRLGLPLHVFKLDRIRISSQPAPSNTDKAAQAPPDFVAKALLQKRPASINDFSLPRTGQYFPSSSDWRGEVLYFILLDRFSDGQEVMRPRLDRRNLEAARSVNWRWDLWAQSGVERWQGGTLRGVRSKLGYLRNLGVTTLWLSPLFKQRGHLDTSHGHSVQDFLDVDPHFGTRQDLVELVQDAHVCKMRVILSVIIGHSGPNWLYPPETPGGPFMPRYTSGAIPSVIGGAVMDNLLRSSRMTKTVSGRWNCRLQICISEQDVEIWALAT